MIENTGSLRKERGEDGVEAPPQDPGLLRFARNDGRAAAEPARAGKTLQSVADLAAAGLIAPEQARALRAVEQRYSVAVTAEITALIDPADPTDPIAKQFLPDLQELVTTAAERADPIGDEAHSPLPGLVHRYEDRVLLKLLSACPVYCRFCFRRESVGAGKNAPLSEGALDAALAYISNHPEIFEAILTGGDPFALSARRLRGLAEKLALIPHVKILRVHTRAPTAAPDLVSTERLEALRASGKTILVVLHVNHWRELAANARGAIERILDAGIPAFSQTVLLKGVNDDAGVLETLLRDLLAARVKPYYLHHPDLAPGTAHFRVTIEDGQRLYGELTQRLSGLALPSYVLDIPGGFGKAPIARQRVFREEDGGWRVLDPSGKAHSYPGEE
jgi:lysine 2,3-aminomutase